MAEEQLDRSELLALTSEIVSSHVSNNAVNQGRPGLAAGEVGYLVAGIKEIDGAPVGDTLTP